MTSGATAQRREKEPVLAQFWVTVFLMDDIGATAAQAVEAIKARHGDRSQRFCVTRASLRRAWSEEGEMEMDQLVVLCHYVAKGANGADARVKIEKVLANVGVTYWGTEVTLAATLRAGGGGAMPEDLPSSSQIAAIASQEAPLA